MSRKSASEEGMGPLERGRGCYQRKDYSAALEAFTQAVNESTEFLLLNALDHRAAALEKLERLQPALKDSKRMIDLKPELSKGYLRCGKILQLKGENELALKIYERGLSKVKIGTDDQRVLLQKMFSKLRQAQGLGKVYDPLQFLPLELALMVCRYLTMRDRMVCLAVTKGWKKVLESMHELWTTLDTTSVKRGIKQQSFKAYLRRSNYSLDRAIITSKAQFDPYKMTYLTKICKNLRTLNIHGPDIIGHSLTDSLPHAKNLQVLTVSRNCSISLSAVGSVLQATQRCLTEASFLNVGHSRMVNIGDIGKLEALKRIELGTPDGGILPFAALQQATPNVISVALSGWSLDLPQIDATPWEHLENLSLTEMSLARVPILPPSLKRLILSGNYRMEIDEIEEEKMNLPLLESLNVHECINLPSSGLFALTRQSIKNGNLKDLDVGGRLHDTMIPARTAYPTSESLETLAFYSMIVGDQEIMAIADLYPNLTRLDVHGTKFTGVGMRYIVERGIKYVNVSQCEDLGEDAVIWARGQNVQVEWNAGQPQVLRRAFRDAFSSFH